MKFETKIVCGRRLRVNAGFSSFNVYIVLTVFVSFRNSKNGVIELLNRARPPLVTIQKLNHIDRIFRNSMLSYL